MSINITRKTLGALAKSVTGEMKHSQKLDAFAKVLGFRDQTALMGTLKTAGAAAPPAPEQPAVLRGEEAMARHVEAALIKARDGWNAEAWLSDWRYEVDNGDIRQCYEIWGESMIEQRGEDITWEISDALDRLAAGPRENETNADVRKSAQERLVWALCQITDPDEPACFNAPANEAVKFLMAGLATDIETHWNLAKSEAANLIGLMEFDPASAAPDADETPHP